MLLKTDRRRVDLKALGATTKVVENQVQKVLEQDQEPASPFLKNQKLEVEILPQNVRWTVKLG